MREIKFRGKRIDNGQWVYGYYHFDDSGGFDAHYITTKHEFNVYDVDPETVGEKTGLKDKNGKEIFEGDVVKGQRFDRFFAGKEFKRFIGEVVYRFCSFQVDGVGKYKGIICEELHGAYEVIGNIYENPELISE